jgi:hypothetical protein
MIRRRAVTLLAVLVGSLLLAAPRAHANGFQDPGGFVPRVPISAFAHPAAWFDPSRLHFNSTVAFGTGVGGRSSALQTLGFSYQFRAPVTLNVSVGNTFGTERSGQNPFFLEGLDVTWRPSRNATFRVEMRDVRSPLQYGYGVGPYGRPSVFADPFTSPY